MSSDYFEAQEVSRGEFEALRRFGDYQELTDGKKDPDYLNRLREKFRTQTL